MAHLGHASSLKLKRESNWNHFKTKPKYDLKLLTKLNQLL